MSNPPSDFDAGGGSAGDRGRAAGHARGRPRDRTRWGRGPRRHPERRAALAARARHRCHVRGLPTQDALTCQSGATALESSRGPENHAFTRDLSPHWPEGSKGAAFRSFAMKYDPNPVTLADLSPGDLELQVKYFYYDLSPKDLDLSLPVRCIDCMKEGHLAETCPGKEVRSLIYVDNNSL